MNERRTVGGTLASAILAGAAPGHKQPMRYDFVPCEQRKDFVRVFDNRMNQIVAELHVEHAQMIYLMYKNLHSSHPFAGDEFMYGHIMGVTLMMVHADKYPKVEVVRKDGNVTIKVTERDGSASASADVDTEQYKEIERRVRGDNEGKA